MSRQEQLKSHNLSVTAVRLAVLETLEKHPHSDAAKLYRLVKGSVRTTSIQAVYNNLNTLVSHGLVRAIRPKGMSALFEIQAGDDHHHLICRRCHSVTDTHHLDNAACLTLIEPQGFKIDQTEILFWGYCPNCQPRLGENL